MFSKSRLCCVCHSYECTLVQLYVVCTYCDVSVSTVGWTPLLAVWVITDRWALRRDSASLVKVKVKCTLVQALRLCTGRTAHRGSRGIALLFLDHGTRRGEVSALRSGRSLPPGKTRYPLYRKLGGPQGWCGQVWKISPPTWFDPRTVHPVASRCTNYATRPTCVFECTKSWDIIWRMWG